MSLQKLSRRSLKKRLSQSSFAGTAESDVQSSDLHSIQTMASELDKAKKELQQQEAKAARVAGKEADKKLKIALKEAEVPKAAQKLADDQIHNYPRSKSDDLKDSGAIRKIRLSVEEFDSMKKKIDELRNDADVKVATAMAQVESINASEKRVLEKLEVILKERE
ncbi:UNVERIFIED_CONTAM: hypothetical protein Sradi_2233700 [Sesamum radiatum]|uniref:DUF5082 domain-containing protein n=1 Tax=Sesamum radiatum TaxID=300843 RepID=A0AAW2T2M4_SESRA